MKLFIHEKRPHIIVMVDSVHIARIKNGLLFSFNILNTGKTPAKDFLIRGNFSKTEIKEPKFDLKDTTKINNNNLSLFPNNNSILLKIPHQIENQDNFDKKQIMKKLSLDNLYFYVECLYKDPLGNSYQTFSVYQLLFESDTLNKKDQYYWLHLKTWENNNLTI